MKIFKRYREGEEVERNEKIYITKSNVVCRTDRPYLVTVHVKKSTQKTVHYVDNSLKV